MIRVVAMPDYLDLLDCDDVFRAILGWDGLGFIFRVHSQDFNSFRRLARPSIRFRDVLARESWQRVPVPKTEPFPELCVPAPEISRVQIARAGVCKVRNNYGIALLNEIEK